MIQESVTVIWVSLYFWFVSKDWQYPYVIVVIICAVFNPLFLWLIPESPKYLYEKERYEECRQVLKKMGRFNGV